MYLLFIVILSSNQAFFQKKTKYFKLKEKSIEQLEQIKNNETELSEESMKTKADLRFCLMA